MTNSESIVMPDLGATDTDIEIEEWLVSEGDVVEAGQPLFLAATDKAVVEVEAFRSGQIASIQVQAGTPVSTGDVLGIIADASAATIAVKQDVSSVSASQKSDEPGESPVVLGTRPPRSVVERVSASQSSQQIGVDADLRISMYEQMTLIRCFEDHLYRLFLQGLVPGTLHQYQGQEAVAVGVCSALRTSDVVFSTHRPVGHALAKGCPVDTIAAELWGKATGCVGGRGGQMHLADAAVGLMPSNAIVGANVPIATGAAIGFDLRNSDSVAVSFSGDGAANIGALHEGINLAAVRRAPVVFVCENNLYGASTHQSQAMCIDDIAERALGYGIPGIVVDGMDVAAVYHAAQTAVARARAGDGPTFIECKTYRFQGHSRGDPGGYRTQQELEHWKSRDPLKLCAEHLTEVESFTQEQLQAISTDCQKRVEAAVTFAQVSPEPAADSVTQHVFAAPKTGSSPQARPVTGEARKMSLVEALREAIATGMETDDTVFLLGEDVGIAGGFGGGFTVSLGLSEQFGHDRILDTPISEIAIVGAAVGAAMTGMRPVAEMQYGDFVFCAMDQVVNQAAKMRYMSNGQVSVPMVLRLPVGASNRGCQHGQSTEAFFMHTPGLKVVCPSNPYDAKGLLLASIRDNDPVIFLEHKLLYGAKGGRQEKTSIDPQASVPPEDYEVPLGTVSVKRAGSDVTILANMLMVHRALEAAERLSDEGIQAEVIDVRCLVPLDIDTLVASAGKTRRVLIVEEDNLTGGWGAEVSAVLYERLFDQLVAPIQRIAAPDTPLPCAASLEQEYVPSVNTIVDTTRSLAAVNKS